jgi:hypothetical protein
VICDSCWAEQETQQWWEQQDQDDNYANQRSH